LTSNQWLLIKNKLLIINLIFTRHVTNPKTREIIMFWTVSGWAIALIALLVNILQLLQNQSLKNKINSSQTIGDKSSGVQQTHSGNGDNINAGRDVTK